jgi:hypothetical protein
MLRFLQSIFNRGAKREKYPETTVRAAIERVAEKIDPWLAAASDYKYKLRPAVILSLDHAARLVNSLPPPIPVEFGPNGSCATLAVFFDSTSEMLNTLKSDNSLAGYLRDHKTSSKRITALLMMEKSEKTIFGAELTGNVVARDVAQSTVTFLNQRFLEPADNENETRRKLEVRAFDHLLRLAHRRVFTAKSVRTNLEKSRSLLQSKIDLLKRTEEPHHDPVSSNILCIAETEEQLVHVEAKLKEQGREDKILDVYLDMAIDILSHPEENLWETTQQMILDQRGIRQTQPKENYCELTFQELCNSDGQRWVMFLITLPVDDLRKFCG